jgi:hypothetical protein
VSCHHFDFISPPIPSRFSSDSLPVY